jgi:FixJ family two-component response regulator
VKRDGWTSLGAITGLTGVREHPIARLVSDHPIAVAPAREAVLRLSQRKHDRVRQVVSTAAARFHATDLEVRGRSRDDDRSNVRSREHATLGSNVVEAQAQ